MSEADPIAVISKSSIDEIRVSWQEFKGHRYLDIRTYTELTGKPQKVATKRGITLHPDLVGELRAALERAVTHHAGASTEGPVTPVRASAEDTGHPL